MAWGNLEVESVELVQDMSYEKLKERLDRALQKGNNEAKEELCRNFDIAVRAVEKKRSNINECIIQCDESFRILLSNLFLILYIIKERLGYSYLEHDLLGEIRKECGKSFSERNLQNMTKNCREEIEEHIEFINEFGKEEAIKKAVTLKILTEGVCGKSVFEIFMDSVQILIGNAYNSTKIEYKSVGKSTFEDSVVRAIYLYVDSEWEKFDSPIRKSWENKLNQVLCKGLDMYNSKYNSQIMTTPFTYALSTIIEQ